METEGVGLIEEAGIRRKESIECKGAEEVVEAEHAIGGRLQRSSRGKQMLKKSRRDI